MSSILYGVERRYLEERRRFCAPAGYQLALDLGPRELTIEELEQEHVEELQQDILAYGLRVGSTTFGKLQDALMEKWFGRMAEKHYRQACKALMKLEKITNKLTGISENSVLQFRR